MIDRFRGKYNFLSNFYSCKVEYEGIVYDCSENAFQASKTLDEEVRKAFMHKDPSTAKRDGKKLALRSDWESIKFFVMYSIVHNKFFQNKSLARNLLDTAEEPLVEGNTWHDTTWGVCNAKGANMLGNILMIVREELKGKSFDKAFEFVTTFYSRNTSYLDIKHADRTCAIVLYNNKIYEGDDHYSALTEAYKDNFVSEKPDEDLYEELSKSLLCDVYNDGYLIAYSKEILDKGVGFFVPYAIENNLDLGYFLSPMDTKAVLLDDCKLPD